MISIALSTASQGESQKIELYGLIKMEMGTEVEKFYTNILQSHAILKTAHVKQLLLLTRAKKRLGLTQKEK